MRWTPSGEMICIVYEDGAVIVGGVDGKTFSIASEVIASASKVKILNNAKNSDCRQSHLGEGLGNFTHAYRLVTWWSTNLVLHSWLRMPHLRFKWELYVKIAYGCCGECGGSFCFKWIVHLAISRNVSNFLKDQVFASVLHNGTIGPRWLGCLFLQ